MFHVQQIKLTQILLTNIRIQISLTIHFIMKQIHGFKFHYQDSNSQPSMLKRKKGSPTFKLSIAAFSLIFAQTKFHLKITLNKMSKIKGFKMKSIFVVIYKNQAIVIISTRINH